jgi:xeroderma pigmentosum group C-complementing protein
MAPRGGKAKAARGRGRGRGRKRPQDDAPDAFRGLLSEAGSSTQDNRPLKRRRITAKSEEEPKQTIVDDSSPDSESESDVEFEDVYLGHANTTTATPAAGQEEPLHIIIEHPKEKNNSNGARKRKPVTAAEKARRLSCHKMHLVFLLYHAFHRNHWCNDARTQVWFP